MERVANTAEREKKTVVRIAASMAPHWPSKAGAGASVLIPRHGRVSLILGF
jgi:hypothetical protein